MSADQTQITNPSDLEKWIDVAVQAKELSYSPYSKFRVGCALVTKDNTIIQGNAFAKAASLEYQLCSQNNHSSLYSY